MKENGKQRKHIRYTYYCRFCGKQETMECIDILNKYEIMRDNNELISLRYLICRLCTYFNKDRDLSRCFEWFKHTAKCECFNNHIGRVFSKTEEPLIIIPDRAWNIMQNSLKVME